MAFPKQTASAIPWLQVLIAAGGRSLPTEAIDQVPTYGPQLPVFRAQYPPAHDRGRARQSSPGVDLYLQARPHPRRGLPQPAPGAAASPKGWVGRTATRCEPRCGRTGGTGPAHCVCRTTRRGAEVQDKRAGGLPMPIRWVLYTAALCGALLAPPSAMPAHVTGSGAHASTARTSRWWTLACGEAGRTRAAEMTACAFTVKLRGVIDGSRLHLVRQALQRRETVRRALQRDVDFHIDVDSPGGEIFAALEIGRLMRAEGASIAVGTGASCLSACVFLLMGAIARTISGDARVGIHRPALGAPQAEGPGHGREEAIVAAMSEQLVLYAQQMHVPRKIIDAMMLIPPNRVDLLSASELATYGISTRDAVAMEKRRARSQSRRPPGAAQGR